MILPRVIPAVVVLASCAVTAVRAQAPDSLYRWRVVAPRVMTLTGRITERRLSEVSGAAASTANPGVIWTIGDSGNPPHLFAVDTTGALLATYRLSGVANVDWEAISLGPCDDATCLYIADTGDNGERRAEVAIHRVVEPMVANGSGEIRDVRTLRVRYPDGPHDVEAIAAFANGSLSIVTKGRSRGVMRFTIPASAWKQPLVTPDGPILLPIRPSGGTGRQVTDMAVNADGTRLVIRTYRDLYLFRISGGDWNPAQSCDIVGREPQGEGVTWLSDGRLALLSERGLFGAGTIHLARCDE